MKILGLKMEKVLILVIATLLFTACKEDETNTNPSIDCGDAVKMVTDTTGLPRENFRLVETDLDENCMTLRLQYSGGCTGIIDFQLYSFGEYELNGITHKKVYISLLDEDDCESLVEKQVKFDLTELTKQMNSPYYINFVNVEDSLLVGGGEVSQFSIIK